VESGGAPDDAVHLLRAAAAVRWCRPDLTAALAEHLLDTVPVGGERWLAAAGWRVHAHAMLGDGRVAAADVLDGMAARLEPVASSSAGALRLRVALAAVARGVGEPARARALLAPALDPAAAPDVRADAWCELARCGALEGGGAGTDGGGAEGIAVGVGEDADGGEIGGGGRGPQEVDGALRAARAAAAELGAAEAPVAAHVAVTAAAAARCAGRPAAASDHAEGGLTVLQFATAVGARPAPLLAAALLAEQVAALRELEPGHRRAAADRAERLLGECGPNRCTVRLRAALAAAGEDDDAVARGLQRAADEAAEIDAPDLEAECRSRLASAWERTGRLDAALTALRLALDAARRDSDRRARVRAALAVAAATWVQGAPRPVDPVPAPSAPAPQRSDVPSVAAGAAGDHSREDERAGGGTGARPRAFQEMTGGGMTGGGMTGGGMTGVVADVARDGQDLPAPAAPAGRHEASGERPPFRPAPASAGDGGRRRRGHPDTQASEVDAEELGLADLLAEALDAFRKL
jgi:hypothetical protein